MYGIRNCRIVIVAGLTIAGLALGAPTAFGQGSEVEPNNTCATAQSLGAIGDGIVFAGSIDAAPSKPDIDFFSVKGTPNVTVTIGLEGAAGGAGTLGDPLVGAFDGQCGLLGMNYVGMNFDSSWTLPLPRLVVTVPPDGVVIVAATSWNDPGFVGSSNGGSYRLKVRPQRAIGAIFGRLIDADTLEPLAPDGITAVELYSYDACAGAPCATSLTEVGMDVDATFRITTDRFGNPLEPGTYALAVATRLPPNGSRVERSRTAPFDVAADAAYAAGDIAVPRMRRGRSVAGRLVDERTGAPLGGGGVNVVIELLRCTEADCQDTYYYPEPDLDGRFVIADDETNNSVVLLEAIYRLRVVSDVYLTVDTDRFLLADGTDIDLGDIAMLPIPRVAAVTGRVVEAGTLRGLPGDDRPFARVSLFGCFQDGCGWLGESEVDGDGRYRFEADAAGRKLPVADYMVQAAAEQYTATDGRRVVTGREDEVVDLGDVALQSLPIRFSEVRSCGDLPPEGGECAYSVRVANGLATALDGAVWSLVTMQSPGSLLGMTRFQAGAPQPLTLPSGASQVVRFTLDIPTRLRAGASICTEALAGQGPTPQFDTLGQRDLFCVTKRSSGFALLSDAEAAAVLRGLHTLLPLPWFDTLGRPDAR